MERLAAKAQQESFWAGPESTSSRDGLMHSPVQNACVGKDFSFRDVTKLFVKRKSVQLGVQDQIPQAGRAGDLFYMPHQ